MALRDRVKILADGTCQVSMPGFDVDTADLDEMSFDSRFSAIGQAVWGNASLPKRVDNNHTGQNTTIAFGRTFSLPPMFLYGWTLSGSSPSLLRPPRISGYDESFWGLQSQVDAKVLVSSVQFRNWYSAVQTSSTVKVFWKALI